MSGPNLTSILGHHTQILDGIQGELSKTSGDFVGLEGAEDIVHPDTGQTFEEFVESREGSISFRAGETLGVNQKSHVQRFYDQSAADVSFGEVPATDAVMLKTQLQQYNFVLQQCELQQPKAGSPEAKACGDARKGYDELINTINDPNFTEKNIFGLDLPNDPYEIDLLKEKVNALPTAGGELDLEADILAQRKPKDIAERALVLRNAVQCWLLYNMEPFADFHKLITSVDSDSYIDEPGYQSKYLYPSTHRQRILLVNEETDGTTLPSKFHARKGTDAFNIIQPHEYAQLMPMLRIFKTYKTKGKDEVVEMEFGNETTLDGIAKQLTLERPVSVGGPNMPDSVYTRGSEVGVKSFEWVNKGQDPFTATKDIEATLTLTAQSFASLAKTRYGDAVGSRRTRAGALSSDRIAYRYLDLIVQPDCADNYSPNCYEIRVDVGYADVKDHKTVGMSEALKKSVSAQKDILYLTLTDHSFNVNEDGTIDIVINYRGRLEGIMKSRKMNILLPAGGYLANELKFAVKGEGGGRKMFTIDTAEAAVKKIRGKKKVTKKDETRIKNYEVALSSVNVKYKQIIHSYIIDRLYSKKKVFEYEVPSEELGIFKLFQADLEGKGDLPKSTGLADVMSGVKHLGPGDGIIKTGLLGQNETLTGVELGRDQDELDPNIANGLEENNRRLLEDPSKVRFFYLGDLVGIILDHIVGDNTVVGDFVVEGILKTDFFEKAKQIKMVAGEAAAFANKPGYRDPQTLSNAIQVRAAFDKFRMVLGNLDVDTSRTPGSSSRSKINLADIPISMEAFNTFFINSVLAKERSNYPFFDFLDDILVEFVMDPISSACFGGLFNLEFVPRVQNFTVPNLIDLKYLVDEPVIPGSGFPSPYKSLKLDEINYENPLFNFDIDSRLITNIYEYVVVTGESRDLDNLTGNEEEDRRNGIIHLTFANALGLVKKISFKKTDQEFLPEARFAEEGNFIFNQLANKYDITIEMIGNNLFKQGQYLYVNTEAIGAGKTNELSMDSDGNILYRSWANLMGLGGYHIVTEVANYVGPDGFNTSVTARWESAGKSPSADIPTVTGP